jgi:hypothetical protein
MVGECELDAFGLEVGSCEHGSEALGSIKGWISRLAEWLSAYQ